jgi:hypothetical protein
MWSNDYGKTWTQPATLAAFISRPSINYFDSFDMATDSAGHIHLLSTGYQMSGEERIGDAPGLYHFEWDGQRWYPPTQVYNGGLIPEYPRVVVERGNQLHVTWFVRHKAYDESIPHQVMYARGTAAAPALEPIVLVREEETTPVRTEPLTVNTIPEATPVQPQPTPTLEALPVLPASPLFTEYDEYLILIIGMIPVAVLMGSAAFFILRKSRRRKR